MSPLHPGPFYELLVSGRIAVAVDDALIEFVGDDRLEWLQGQCTQDLRRLREGETLEAGLCSATGHLLAHLAVFAMPDRIWVTTSRSGAAHVMSRVESAVIMEDVSAAVLNPARPLVAHYGADGVGIPRDRFGRLGWESLAADDEAVSDDASLEVLRLEAARASVDVDAQDKTLAPELGPDFVARTISYTKGCYTGQEVLMRIHSRGHTNRTWRVLHADRPVARGAEVIGSDGRLAGAVTSSVVSPRFGPLCAGVLRDKAVDGLETAIVRDGDGETLARWHVPNR